MLMYIVEGLPQTIQIFVPVHLMANNVLPLDKLNKYLMFNYILFVMLEEVTFK